MMQKIKMKSFTRIFFSMIRFCHLFKTNNNALCRIDNDGVATKEFVKRVQFMHADFQHFVEVSSIEDRK